MLTEPAQCQHLAGPLGPERPARRQPAPATATTASSSITSSA